MSTAEVVAAQLNDKSLRPEAEEDTHTVSSEGSLSRSQCTPDAADSEDEFVDAMEPPSSSSGVLMAFDGTAPPLSGVYEDALEATELQVEAALQSTSSDGSGRQSTIQEEEEGEDEEVETEANEIEAEVIAVVENIVETTATAESISSTPTADSREEERAEPIHENVDIQVETESAIGAHVESVQAGDIVEDNAEELACDEAALDEGYVAVEDKTDEQTTAGENALEEAELEGTSVDAGGDALPAETTNCEGEASDAALATTTTDESVSEDAIADKPENAPIDPVDEANELDTNESDQVAAIPETDEAVGPEEVVPYEQDTANSVEETGDMKIESREDAEPTSKEDVNAEVSVVDNSVVEEIQGATMPNATRDDTEILSCEEPAEVNSTSQQTSVDTVSEPSSSAIDGGFASEESAGKDTVENEVEVAAVDQEANAKDGGGIDTPADEDKPSATDEDTSQEEPIAEEVSEEPNTPTDEQVTAPESTANTAESVTEAADEDPVEGTEQESSHPEEDVNTVHAGAKEITTEAVQGEENQHEEINGAGACQSEAPVDPRNAESGDPEEKPAAEPVDEQPTADAAIPADNNVETVANAVASEHKPAEEETEVAPVLKEAPTSSRRKSSDDHELGNPAAVSLLPRLAPSSGTTTTTSIDPFILTADSNDMHFPTQRFTYDVFGFSIENRVVFYHVHRSDRRTGIREPAILKRYTDFRDLQLQLLDSCLRVAADMPRIPRPHLGTVLRGYKSKKTIEIREHAFRALLRYIAQYPALHGSATFERFITTSRASANAGWM